MGSSGEKMPNPLEPSPSSSFERKASIADSGEIERRRLFVKEMIRKAWQGAKCALGGDRDNSILAMKRSSSETNYRMLVSQDSMVNAMTTFALTGMEAEFEQGTRWVETQLEFEKLDKDLSVSRIVSSYIGALLSCFALTWNRIFLDKAEQLALKLEPAYKSETGLPYHAINPATGQATGSLVWLSEIAGGAIEYAFLSDITDDPRFKNRSEVGRKFLASKEKPKGLYMWKVDVETGNWANTTSTVSFAARGFYRNLVKSYFYSGKKDIQALQMYGEAMAAIQVSGMLPKSRTGLTYARDLDTSTGVYDEFMSHCSAYLGALFAQGSVALQTQSTVPDSLVGQHLQMARALTETCHEACKRTATKLPPGRFYFNDTDDATNTSPYDREYSLSPEVAESYFVLWRTTKNPKYREYAWELAQAIEEQCLDAATGYWDLVDVNVVNPSKKAHLHDPHFISGTLKYLYLTFCEDHVLPLELWVFNSAGNPLPVGAHDKGLQLEK